MNLNNENKSEECNTKISELEDIINDLNIQLNNERKITNSTKEYLFVLENTIVRKDRDIKRQKKQIKKLKKENKLIKNSTSWKITEPLRKFMNIIRR